MGKLILLFIGLAVLFAAAGIRVLMAGSVSDPDMIEIGRWLLTLSAGSATAGAFTAAFRLVESRRVERESWGRRLSELMAGHDAVQVAKSRIAAHKTARAYSEEVTRLTAVRAQLRRLDDEPDVRDADLLRVSLKRMWTYLEDLGVEYEAKYLRAARQQRADEAWLTTQAKRYAEKSEQPPDEFFGALPAGQLLENAKEFPNLVAFLKEFEKSKFIIGFKDARDELEKRSGVRSRRDDVRLHGEAEASQSMTENLP